MLRCKGLMFSFFSSDGGSQYSNILMLLRKAANHPLLLRNHFNDSILLKMAKKYCKVWTFFKLEKQSVKWLMTMTRTLFVGLTLQPFFFKLKTYFKESKDFSSLLNQVVHGLIRC